MNDPRPMFATDEATLDTLRADWCQRESFRMLAATYKPRRDFMCFMHASAYRIKSIREKAIAEAFGGSEGNPKGASLAFLWRIL